jgi:hypothetical protein
MVATTAVSTGVALLITSHSDAMLFRLSTSDMVPEGCAALEAAPAMGAGGGGPSRLAGSTARRQGRGPRRAARLRPGCACKLDS